MHSDDTAAFIIQVAANKAAPELFDEINSSDIGQGAYAFKMRVKKEKDLVEKTTRKKIDKPNYQLQDITDVIGLRLVTLFRSEMPVIVDQLLEKILDEKSNNFFVKDSLKEIIVYSSQNVEFDEISQRVDALVKKRSIDERIFDTKESNTGYSSIHLVAQIDRSLTWPGGSIQSGFDGYLIPIEIQVRTVFEDAWGEIDHKFYKARRSKKLHGVQETKFSKHLRTLKRFTDACGEYADAIESDYNGSHGSYGVEILDIDRGDSVADRLSEVGVSPELITEFMEIGKKSKVNLREPTSLFLQPDNYLKIAKLYEQLSSKVTGSSNLSSDGHRIFGYYLKMYQALNLLRSGIKREVVRASVIYEKIVHEYPGFPVPLFRLGQSLGDSGNFDGALGYFAEALKLVGELSKTPVSERLDKLPEEDRLHLKYTIPKLIGYQYWKKSTQLSGTEAMEMMRSAYEETEKANLYDVADVDWVELEEHQVNIANNMLYYAVKYSEMLQESGETSFPYQADIDAQLEFLLTKIDIEQSENLSVLDTLSLAFVYLDRIEEAKLAAGRILDIVLGDGSPDDDNAPSSSGLSPELSELVRQAFGILRR